MSTYAAGKSGLYVSSGFETPQGVLQTLDTSFFVNSCSVNLKEQQAADDQITGYLAAISRTRLSLSAAGAISIPMHAAGAGWMLKMLFGAAPTSAVATPSATVYTHTWNSFADPKTFSLMKQSAQISTYTETICGNGVKTFDLKSGKKIAELSLGVDGLGAGYILGTAKPSTSVAPTDVFVTPATSLPYVVGITSGISRNGTPITPGLFMADWSLKVDPGYGVLDTGGSTDGSMTRFDITGARKVTADFTLLEQSRGNLDDFLAQTVNAWSFTVNGPVLDVANSLSEKLTITLNKARMVDMWPSDIGGHGVFMIKMKIEAMIDTSTGYDVTAVLQDLKASY
jgi:hypothetical protein